MENFLKQLMGKKIDVVCSGTAGVRGEVVNVEGGILYLRDEKETVSYVAVEKIAIIWETKESESRAGFVGLK